MTAFNPSAIKKVLIVVVLVTLSLDLISQCASCNILIADNSVSSYTVSTGNNLCIANNFTYTGHIYLKGGTVCNDGVINKIHFYSGILNNNFNGKLSVNTSTNLSFNLDGKCVINNYSGSQIITSSDISINTDHNDSLVINIHKGASVNCNDLLINTGKVRMNIGLAPTTVTNNPFITSMNVNGNATFKSDLNLTIKDVASFNTNGSLVLRDEGIKTINNYGIVNVTGTIGVLGDGNTTSTITINNYGNFSAFASITSSIIEAIVLVNNIGGAANSSMYIDGSLEFQQSNLVFTNDGVLELGATVGVNNSTLINNSFIQAKDLTVNNGGFSNNSKTTLAGGLTISGTDGVINNNGSIISTDQLTNSGTFNFSKRSICSVGNFDNTASTGRIIGPDNILDETSHEDQKNYAKLFIKEQSTSSGTITGFVAVFELSYSGSSEIRFDQVDETSQIGGDVKFPTECEFELEVGVVDAWSANSRGPRNTFCPGENLTIKFNPFVPITSGPNWTYSITATLISPSGNNLSVGGIQAGGMVNVSGSYYNGFQSCPFSIDYLLSIGNGSIAATSPVYFGVGNNVTLNTTVTVGSAPFQFTWSPNYFFVAPSTNSDGDPIVSPGVSLIYTVNVVDGYGCSASTTVEVIGEPFALLNKELDGEYYKLVNNQLFFKYDGQYDTSDFTYYVYDKNNTVVASNPPSAAGNLVNITSVSPGDNRLTLNASSGSLGSGFYVLEVINEKKERLYLRFQK